ncbi:MAG: silent information regulator protein Sir2, partial [Micromonosporaceae bacterium]|nr:silent information regulator protein Sir2 [Micromonosporaceae bacterium]
AYALAPNAEEGQLRSYQNGPLTVLANNPRVQAVKHTGLGLTAANVFAAGRHEAAGLSVDGPASVIMQTRPGNVTAVGASDPTMDRDTATVLVRGRRLTTVSADDGVRASWVAGGTLLEFDTHEAHGRSLTTTLRG